MNLTHNLGSACQMRRDRSVPRAAPKDHPRTKSRAIVSPDALRGFDPVVSRRALLGSAVAFVMMRPAAASDAVTDPLATLVGLMRDRLGLMVEVARSKWNTGTPVEDLAREKSLADSVAQLAPRYGLDPQRAAAFFRAQIEAAKLVESALIARWTRNHLGGFADTLDQRTAIRPKIDQLTEQLLAALAAATPALRPDSAARIVEAADSPDEVTAFAMTRALQPLLESCRVKATQSPRGDSSDPGQGVSR
jgi:chorismate mutase